MDKALRQLVQSLYPLDCGGLAVIALAQWAEISSVGTWLQF